MMPGDSRTEKSIAVRTGARRNYRDRKLSAGGVTQVNNGFCPKAGGGSNLDDDIAPDRRALESYRHRPKRPLARAHPRATP